MEYSRSRKVGAVELYETFEGNVNEIAELTKALTVKENENSLVEQINQWKTEIAKLAKRNIDIGLLKEFNSLGPKCLNEIMALNSLTDKEFDEYCELYKERERLYFEQLHKQI